MTDALLPPLSPKQRELLAALYGAASYQATPLTRRSIDALARRSLVAGNLVDGYIITPAGRHAHEVLARAGK